MAATITSDADEALRTALTLLDSPPSCCGHPARDMLTLLRENAPLYHGRGAVETERLRAYVLARVAKAGLANEAFPYVLEELETGQSPYGIAAAALALRSTTALPAETPDLLAAAIERIRPVDEFVDFETYPARPDARGRTAVAEATEALAIIKARRAPVAETVTCCGSVSSADLKTERPALSANALLKIELQNQDGIHRTFGEIFGGRTSLITFFYTRCMNPDKCSRTISKLAAVRKLVDRKHPGNDVVVSAITYDPDYDLPERLHRYGSERGLQFGATCQLLRTRGSFEAIRNALQLGVGYGPTTVNRHSVELVLVDRSGAIVDFRTRRLWDEEVVADAIEAAERGRQRATPRQADIGRAITSP